MTRTGKNEKGPGTERYVQNRQEGQGYCSMSKGEKQTTVGVKMEKKIGLSMVSSEQLREKGEEREDPRR